MMFLTLRVLQNNTTGGFRNPSLNNYDVTIYSMLKGILPIIFQFNMDDSMTVKIQYCVRFRNSKRILYM